MDETLKKGIFAVKFHAEEENTQEVFQEIITGLKQILNYKPAINNENKEAAKRLLDKITNILLDEAAMFEGPGFSWNLFDRQLAQEAYLFLQIILARFLKVVTQADSEGADIKESLRFYDSILNIIKVNYLS